MPIRFCPRSLWGERRLLFVQEQAGDVQRPNPEVPPPSFDAREAAEQRVQRVNELIDTVKNQARSGEALGRRLEGRAGTSPESLLLMRQMRLQQMRQRLNVAATAYALNRAGPMTQAYMQMPRGGPMGSRRRFGPPRGPGGRMSPGQTTGLDATLPTDLPEGEVPDMTAPEGGLPEGGVPRGRRYAGPGRPGRMNRPGRPGRLMPTPDGTSPIADMGVPLEQYGPDGAAVTGRIPRRGPRRPPTTSESGEAPPTGRRPGRIRPRGEQPVAPDVMPDTTPRGPGRGPRTSPRSGPRPRVAPGNLEQPGETDRAWLRQLNDRTNLMIDVRGGRMLQPSESRILNNRERDPAGISSFDFPRNEPIGYLSLHDPVDQWEVDQLRTFPQLMRDNGYQFVLSERSVQPGTRPAAQMLREQIRGLSDRGVRYVYINLMPHGSRDGRMVFQQPNGTRLYLEPNEVTALTREFREMRFFINVNACFGGGFHAADFRDPTVTDLVPRVTVVSQSQPDTPTSVMSMGPNRGVSYYDAVLLQYLQRGLPYGQAHVLASETVAQMFRANPGMVPTAYRSGRNRGISTTTPRAA